jgi:fatty-acyl-CoA synthase
MRSTVTKAADPRSSSPPTALARRAEREGGLVPDPGTVGRLLRDAAERHPGRAALVFADCEGATSRRWTYAELLAEAEQVARRLLRDLSPGEHVALWAANRPEWVLAQLGIALAGMVLVPVNPAFTAEEADYVLADSAAVALLADGEFRGVSRAAMCQRLAANRPALRQVVNLDGWSAWLAEDTGDRGLPEVRPTDTAQILYTSGTTGRPKGVVLHHAGLTTTPNVAARLFDLGDAPRWLNAMPLFHIGGCGLPVIGCLTLAATHILAERYRADLVLDLVSRERVTFFGGVPAMILDILGRYDPDRHDVSSLRHLLTGAAEVSPDLVGEVERVLGVSFGVAYGQTEVHGHIAQTRVDDTAADKAATVGQPLPHVEVRVVDADGRELGPGRPGELWCRSVALMSGYHGNPKATADTVPGEGWLRTGDVCSADERGFLTFHGRTGDLINRGGEKFAPREIEDALAAHPSVTAAAVLGLPDARLGARVAAMVVPATPAGCDPAELSAYLATRLAPFKIPERWLRVDELPLTSSGKLARHRLLDSWEQRA